MTSRVIAYACLVALLATAGSWLTVRFRRGWYASVALAAVGSVTLWTLGLFPGSPVA